MPGHEFARSCRDTLVLILFCGNICLSVCLSVWPSGYGRRLSRERVWVRTPEQASLTPALIVPRSAKWAAIGIQWVTGVEHCECKPQVQEDRWPRVVYIVRIYSACELVVMKRTWAQIRVLNCWRSARNLQVDWRQCCSLYIHLYVIRRGGISSVVSRRLAAALHGGVSNKSRCTANTTGCSYNTRQI